MWFFLGGLFPLRPPVSAVCQPLLPSTPTGLAVFPDVRMRLLSELKSAMKNKDTLKSTTIRSILAEIYAADKAPGHTQPVSSPVIASIIRKAAVRRTDAASDFQKASRPDLAAKETREAELLQAFLPPLLPEAEIDRVLRAILSEQPDIADDMNSRKVLGVIFKAFYSKVDRTLVDADLVRRRADALLSSRATTA
ncbi:hypothetical protein AcW1_003668 [Taiwanofungus camphoratus]|nr:hypothetical protein AcV5_007366 [Antrodia cinnamomea]KAI0940488.1 hypothetical protein AcW1_003668 [Antrodia cinnamomea]KAI0958342.1 hypothetical protein AcV7_004185 [Antrodia cinnamomea]